MFTVIVRRTPVVETKDVVATIKVPLRNVTAQETASASDDDEAHCLPQYNIRRQGTRPTDIYEHGKTSTR